MLIATPRAKASACKNVYTAPQQIAARYPIWAHVVFRSEQSFKAKSPGADNTPTKCENVQRPKNGEVQITAENVFAPIACYR